MIKAAMIVASFLLASATGCRVYCDEDEFDCDLSEPASGLALLIIPPETVFPTGEWHFAFDIHDPEIVAIDLTCFAQSDVPSRLLCDEPSGLGGIYDLRIESDDSSLLELRITRSGVEPLAREGKDVGVSGPSRVSLRVLYDATQIFSGELQPAYTADEMKSGPETCVVCLGAREEVAL